MIGAYDSGTCTMWMVMGIVVWGSMSRPRHSGISGRGVTDLPEEAARYEQAASSLHPTFRGLNWILQRADSIGFNNQLVVKLYAPPATARTLLVELNILVLLDRAIISMFEPLSEARLLSNLMSFAYTCCTPAGYDLWLQIRSRVNKNGGPRCRRTTLSSSDPLNKYCRPCEPRH